MHLNPIRFWIFTCLFLYLMIGCSNANENAPMKSKRLSPCPESPNCVSSLTKDEAHAINPLTYTGYSLDAFARFKKILLDMPDTRLVTGNEDYIHVEFRTRFLGFVDDVEAQLNTSDNTIEIRSASRTGYWDFGVNKKRVESIRKRFSGSDEF